MLKIIGAKIIDPINMHVLLRAIRTSSSQLNDEHSIIIAEHTNVQLLSCGRLQLFKFIQVQFLNIKYLKKIGIMVYTNMKIRFQNIAFCKTKLNLSCKCSV